MTLSQWGSGQNKRLIKKKNTKSKKSTKQSETAVAEKEAKKEKESSRETVTEEELEMHYARYRDILKNLTIMNDIFMRNVLKEPECTEYVLQVILGNAGLHVIDQVIQKDYKNLQGRSAILDCVARDASGRQMDVEIQQENEGASPKRARYHSGLMDMNTLNPGETFDKLPETYVIFITRDDYLGHGLPIYHIDRKITELGRDFCDEAHIIYVNAKYRDDTELGHLLHDLHCTRAEDMYSQVLAKRVRELKETEKGVESMSHELEELYNEGIERGMQRGELSKAREITRSLGEMGMSVEKIAQIVKISAGVVQEWLSESAKAPN